MASYDRLLDILELELANVAETFSSVTTSQWTRRTLLRPPPGSSPWTLAELAGHLDIVAFLEFCSHVLPPGDDGVCVSDCHYLLMFAHQT